MDKISSLPNDVLGHILSFLPTKQAASTSILSKRWRNVYVLVSHIDVNSNRWYGDFLRFYPRSFFDFVQNLLNRQGNSPIKKLTLKTPLDFIDSLRVKGWICNALERGVVELDLFLTFHWPSQPLPSLIFKSKTLTKLRLGRHINLKLSQDVYLPMLKTLYLDSVHCGGDHDVIETLLPRCPMLEELFIKEQGCQRRCVFVSSLSLKKLSINIFTSPSISLDAPNLVYLELTSTYGCKYINVNSDSLVRARLNLWVDDRQLQELRRGAAHLVPVDMIGLINGIRNVKVLHLTSDALELMYISGQDLPMFNNLVCLSIASRQRQGWQILPVLIKNSPNLETLISKGLEHYITEKWGDACVCCGFCENSSCCLSSSRVKVLEICGYRGTSRELNQIKHFLKQLPCLELVKIRTVYNLQVPTDTQYLMAFPRASSKCKIQVNF